MKVEKMRIVKFVVVVFFSFLFAGCTVPMGKTVGELDSTYAGQQLVVYRPLDKGGLYFPGVLNGKEIKSSLTAGSVVVEPLPQGANNFTVVLPALQPGSAVKANVLAFDAKPNERKFVRARLVSFEEPAVLTLLLGPGIGTWTFTVEEVDPVTAADEIRNLKFAN
jgi:hypothetical protein